MANKALIFALLAVAAPAWATTDTTPPTGAPPGGPSTLYCMKVTITGEIPDPVECWTRDEWADQGVDVDKEWAKNGVRTEG